MSRGNPLAPGQSTGKGAHPTSDVSATLPHPVAAKEAPGKTASPQVAFERDVNYLNSNGVSTTATGTLTTHLSGLSAEDKAKALKLVRGNSDIGCEMEVTRQAYVDTLNATLKERGSRISTYDEFTSAVNQAEKQVGMTY
jgi:hypothetical protein